MKILYIAFLQVFTLISVNAQTENQKTSVVNQKDLHDSTFTHVDVESAFPGGAPAWSRFLRDNLVYPKKAVKKDIQGTVTAQFIVDKDGTVSNIDAVDGPEMLREAAIDVIKKSPNWKPATQNGRKVKSYKKQPITFKLEQGT
ncbi:MAG: energy transducer TonB [Bacteroidota bacterium]